MFHKNIIIYIIIFEHSFPAHCDKFVFCLFNLCIYLFGSLLCRTTKIFTFLHNSILQTISTYNATAPHSRAIISKYIYCILFTIFKIWYQHIVEYQNTAFHLERRHWLQIGYFPVYTSIRYAFLSCVFFPKVMCVIFCLIL